jgi:DNA-directed RNA polymerase specialized sigma24 family protein
MKKSKSQVPVTKILKDLRSKTDPSQQATIVEYYRQQARNLAAKQVNKKYNGIVDLTQIANDALLASLNQIKKQDFPDRDRFEKTLKAIIKRRSISAIRITKAKKRPESRPRAEDYDPSQKTDSQLDPAAMATANELAALSLKFLLATYDDPQRTLILLGFFLNYAPNAIRDVLLDQYPLEGLSLSNIRLILQSFESQLRQHFQQLGSPKNAPKKTPPKKPKKKKS